jgi:hypothetical protein
MFLVMVDEVKAGVVEAAAGRRSWSEKKRVG